MLFKRTLSPNLFLSGSIVFLLLFLISLPGLAYTAIDSIPATTGTYTPTATSGLTQPGNISTDSPTPTLSATQNIVITDTLTPSPTFTSTPTFTPTPSFTPTEPPTPLPTQFLFLPYLYRQHFIPPYTPTPTPPPPPPDEVLYCDNLTDPVYIPDNNSNGITDEI